MIYDGCHARGDSSDALLLRVGFLFIFLLGFFVN